MQGIRGFTLIELAIVIAVIGILASVAVPRFVNITKSAEEAVLEEYLVNLQTSAAFYFSEQGTPPNKFNDFVTTGNLAPPHTLSLKVLQNSTSFVSVTPPTMASNQMLIEMSSGSKMRHYLNGVDVTAEFE